MELGSFDEIQTAFAQGKLQAFLIAEAPATKLRSEKQDIGLRWMYASTGSARASSAQHHVDRTTQGKRIAVAEGTSSHYVS